MQFPYEITRRPHLMTDLHVGDDMITVSSVDYILVGSPDSSVRVNDTAVIWPNGDIVIEGTYEDHAAVVARLKHA